MNDDADDLASTDALPPGGRDPRAMSAAAFGLFRFLSPEERAALARRPRFRFAPWLRLVTRDGPPAPNPDDLLP